jgi:hypothetical protein
MQGVKLSFGEPGNYFIPKPILADGKVVVEP